MVRREVSRSGRNRVFVDDQPVTLKLLTELAPSLLRIHGQREELGLVDPELQRFWLDRCGGEEAASLLAEAGRLYAAARSLEERLERLRGDQRQRSERIEFLRYQVAEIGGVAPAGRRRAGAAPGARPFAPQRSASSGRSAAPSKGFTTSSLRRTARWSRRPSALEGIREWETRAPAWLAELDGAAHPAR